MDKILTLALVILSLSQVIYLSPVLNAMLENGVFQEADDFEVNITNHLIDEIKARILRSLHKMEAPKTHVSLPRLQILNSGDEWETGSESARNKTTTEFLLADVENISCNGQPCHKIHFNLLPQDSQSAELWLYKKQDISEFLITHIVSFNDNEEKETLTTHIYNQTHLNSWIRFDVSHMIAVKNITSLEFQVSGDTNCLEVDGDKKPFLLIHKDITAISISKRSVPDCGNDSSTCCRHKYFINFKDVGWSNWIVEPEGYEANYCKGSCSGNIGMLSSHHARVLNELCNRSPDKAQAIGNPECVSCTSTAYRPISIIYLDEQDVQVVSHMPKMSVTECGCS